MGFIDLTNQKFGMLRAIKYDKKYINKNGKKTPVWWCECDCGNPELVPVSRASLKTGNTKSCGCLKIKHLIEYNKQTKTKTNKYDLTREYGIGWTSKGEEFYFDLEDYNKIKDICWYIDSNGYLQNSYYDENHIKQFILMHRIIMDCKDLNFDIDHIHGKTSRNDNRKSNLRICEHQKNMCNYTKPKNNTSGITGVSFDNTHQVWKAYITYNNRRINLGNFQIKDDAIKARLLAEKEYFGEYSAQKHLFEKYGIETN